MSGVDDSTAPHGVTSSKISEGMRLQKPCRTLPHVSWKKISLGKSSPCFVMPCGRIWSSIILTTSIWSSDMTCLLLFWDSRWSTMIGQSHHRMDLYMKAMENHPAFHVGRKARPLQKLGDKGWPPYQGQSVSNTSGTACYIHMSYPYARIIKIIHIIHVIMHVYIYPHIMPYCNIHGQLKMTRKGCTWWDSAWLHTFNWSCTYWSSVMSGDKPSNSSQATGECIKRWYLISNRLWRVKHNEEYWNLIHLSFLMSQTFEVSFLDLLELCRLHL